MSQDVELLADLMSDGASYGEALVVLSLARQCSAIELARGSHFNPSEPRDRRGQWSKAGGGGGGARMASRASAVSGYQSGGRMSVRARQSAMAARERAAVGPNKYVQPHPGTKAVAEVATQAQAYTDQKIEERARQQVAHMMSQIEEANAALEKARAKEDTKKHRQAFAVRVGTLVAGALVAAAEIHFELPELTVIASSLGPASVMEFILLKRRL